MDKMKSFWELLKQRWNKTMPKFFKLMFEIFAFIGGTALAANEAMVLAGIEPHEWWVDIRPYLIAVPAGAMFVCKFTVDGGFRDKTLERNNTILEKDDC